MDKNEEDKLVNAIIGLHHEIKKQGAETSKHLARLNLAVGELRLSYEKLDERLGKLDERLVKLDESFNKYAKLNEARLSGHENRIVRLEEKTFGDSLIAREPAAVYKRKKRK